MAYSIDKSGEITIDGWDSGIAASPHKGLGNLQSVNIATETGEVMCSFNRIKQSQTGTTGTLTQVNTNTVSVSGLTLLVGQVITITDAGTTGLNVPFTPLSSVQALVVGGGGGGGIINSQPGGGGGAGEVKYDNFHTVTAGAYAITIGAGGPSTVNGGNSIFDTLTSLGGGKGGTGQTGGANGGSGGGAGGSGGGALTGGSSTATSGGFGNAGGNTGAGVGTAAAGGGGSGTVGSDASGGVGGNGGNGVTSSISGSPVIYGGGGGGASTGTGGSGGTGGGGNGEGPGAPTAGADNTGGGGGGAVSGTAGAGGSGVVIISYPTTSTPNATGGTITTSGGMTIHTFTTTGTFTVLPAQTGDYYYLSTGKLYAGNLPPSNPSTATPVTGITAGTATFTITYPLSQPYQSATEVYTDASVVTQYRYYILDTLGQVWCHDTATVGGGFDTPLWFFVGVSPSGPNASGLAVYEGWVTISYLDHTYWKLTSLLGAPWVDTTGSISMISNSPRSTLNGRSKLYWTDGNHIASLLADNSSLTGGINLQSYALWTTPLGADRVTNGSFTGSAISWTLTSGWTWASDSVSHTSNGTTDLSQNIGAGVNTLYAVTFTISNRTAGNVTPKIGTNVGTAVSVNGTYTQYIASPIAGGSLIFTPSNTARFTIDNVSVKEAKSMAYLISGSFPTIEIFATRIPALFFTNGALPTAITAGTIYYIVYTGTSFQVFSAASGGDPLDTVTGASGDQYFNTFDPTSAAGQTLTIFSPQALFLPYYEVAQCMANIGSVVLIGGRGNVLYPWDEVNSLTGDIITLPENNTVNIVVVNNMGYVFTGQKGNVYITNGSTASPVISVPDYCAGIAGTPNSYIEPYFAWGGAMYVRGRVWFSILDQTVTKTGNCGGIWSFIPTQNLFIGQDTGLSLRLENQSSYGTYNGVSPVLLASQQQQAMGVQYWSGWYSSISAPTYGIDFTDTIPTTPAVIETDLIPTGDILNKRTFEQIGYQLSTPLASGETVTVFYRQNGNASYASAGTVKAESVTDLSGYFSINFEKGQWLQLKIILTPLASSSSSFVRLKTINIR